MYICFTMSHIHMHHIKCRFPLPHYIRQHISQRRLYAQETHKKLETLNLTLFLINKNVCKRLGRQSVRHIGWSVASVTRHMRRG